MTVSLVWLAQQFPELSQFAPLGRGGQKVVFSAAHASEGEVVLKLLHLNQDAESVRREILAVMNVSSHRVPRILEQGECDTPMGKCSWIREQRIHGQPLRSYLPRLLSAHEVLRLTFQTLEALRDAEKVNIVHRDVKPDNIMLDKSGDFWLLDFGIARHLDLQSMTPTANPYGKVTWGYAPLEQCRNFKADIDARADLFALGVTIHEMATGINPFRESARDPLEILRRVEKTNLLPLLLPIVAAQSFRDLLSAMTQKRRGHRMSTAHEALAWCQEILLAEGMQITK